MPDDDEDLRARVQVVEHELARALNALRETQVDHGNAILELRAETADMRSEMRGGFATLTAGMEHITTLLTRVIEGGE